MDEISPLAAFTRVGHALFARNGVKLAFGMHWKHGLLHISQVARGVACGCTCPAENCRRTLIAKKPESDIEHHFAHAPLTEAEREAGIAPNCEHGSMTALHIHAERLLNERKSLVLPAVEAHLESRTRRVRKAGGYTFDSAKLEKMDGETIPDVILFKGDQRMHVEVYVTNKCGQEKRDKIVAAQISAVEVNLSHLRKKASELTIEELNREILEAAPREWIYNRKRQEALVTLEAEAAKAAVLAKEKRQKEIDSVRNEYVAAKDCALGSNWADSPGVLALQQPGFAELLESPAGGEGYFSVHPKVWKATILGSLLKPHWGTTPLAILQEFGNRGWLIGRFRSLALWDDDLVKEARLPAGGPEAVVTRFLQHLAKKGVVEDRGWDWQFTSRHTAEIECRRRKKEIEAYEATRRSARHKQLAKLVGEIVEIGGGAEKLTFSYEGWLSNGEEDRTRSQIVDEGGQEWRDLLKGLTATLAVLNDKSEDNAEDFGLPVRPALDAMRAMQAARAAERKLEAEAAERKEQEARIATIVQLATDALGDAADDWLDRPLEALKEATPRASAAGSPEGLEKTRALLGKQLEAMELKAKWVEAFEREVRTLFGRNDKAALYMNSSEPKLPGGASPKAYIKDEQTMRHCLDLLRQRLGKRRT
jgi:hypothetical protein